MLRSTMANASLRQWRVESTSLRRRMTRLSSGGWVHDVGESPKPPGPGVHGRKVMATRVRSRRPICHVRLTAVTMTMADGYGRGSVRSGRPAVAGDSMANGHDWESPSATARRFVESSPLGQRSTQCPSHLSAMSGLVRFPFVAVRPAVPCDLCRRRAARARPAR